MPPRPAKGKALGPDHPDVGTLLNNLATLHRHQGNDNAPLPLFEHALAIFAKALGPDHPHNKFARDNLMALLSGGGAP